jgi:hypothetical protein
MTLASQSEERRLERSRASDKRTPGREAQALKLEAVFSETYFVAGGIGVGAGVAAVVASVFVVSLFTAPVFFVTFLCVFFTVFLLVGDVVVDVVEAFSVVAPVMGFVVVLGPVCVVVVASWAKATPNDRRATATRAERVFFIFFSIPLFLWPVRGLPTGSLAATALPRAGPASLQRYNQRF